MDKTKIYISGNKNKGKYVTIDPEWYDVLSQCRWYLNHAGCVHKIYHKLPLGSTMAGIVAGVKPGKGSVMHLNGDGLDCRASNLQVVKKKHHARKSPRAKTDTLIDKVSVFYSLPKEKQESLIKSIPLGVVKQAWTLHTSDTLI